ncbi:MAG: nucleotide exchange factor GrpE [Oscillospiraceae bacterium]
MAQMNENEHTAPEAEQAEETTDTPETQETTETPEAPEEQPQEAADQSAQLLATAEEKYLRLAAEYDNYRKRSAKEKESAWTDAKANTAAAFLPVYDNLERALKAPCSDEAFLKGVEMTMNQMKEVLTKLGIEEIPALGEKFDANLHNAVMHVDDDSVEENTVVEVFQTGFKTGDKVIRFAMVKVAN